MMRKMLAGRISTFVLLVFAGGAMLTGCAGKNMYADLQGLTSENVQSAFSEEGTAGGLKLGIAFGGGGVRGFAHLGVLKALDEAKIRPVIATGSSVGAVAAVLYASGLSYPEIESVVLSVKPGDVTDVVVSREGRINGKAVADWLNRITGNIDMEELHIPAGVTVTDVVRGESLLVVEGNAGRAVQASVTLPGMVIPVEAGGSIWVDGGLLSLVPVRFARSMGAEVVIGVDVLCGEPLPVTTERSRMVSQVMRLQSCKLAEQEMAEADYLVRPVGGSLNGRYRSREEAIEAGYRAGKQVVGLLTGEIRRLTE